MKKTLLMSVAGVIFLSACQKQAENNPSPVALSSKVMPPAIQTTAQTDTVPDGAMMTLRLQQDSSSIDETSFGFNHSASRDFSSSEDAPYFAGFGKGSLCSLTLDGVKCGAQILRSSPGAIRIKVTAKNDGVYLLKTGFTKNIPANMGIWLKDAYRKDSLNLRLWNYRFDIVKSDTNTYSAGRFSVVMH